MSSCSAKAAITCGVLIAIGSVGIGSTAASDLRDAPPMFALSAAELDTVRAGDDWIVVITTNPYAVAKASIGNPSVPGTGILCINGLCNPPATNPLVWFLRPLFF